MFLLSVGGWLKVWFGTTLTETPGQAVEVRLPHVILTRKVGYASSSRRRVTATGLRQGPVGLSCHWLWSGEPSGYLGWTRSSQWLRFVIYFDGSTLVLPVTRYAHYMSISPYGRLNAARVAKFESVLGFALPKDYREFLLLNNGGKFHGATVLVPGLDERVALDVFLGLDLEQGQNLDEWNLTMRKDLTDGSLIIGTDPGGGFILLSAYSSWAGVYYWDHAFWFEKSSPKNNLYLIAESFSALMAMVK